MKYLSQFRLTVKACGIIAAVALFASCSSSIAPKKAAKRLAQSPVTSVFSYNSFHLPKGRECKEAGPLSKRARNALITWLHNSTVKEISYAYPQYYLTTTNARGGGEVVWAILSDAKGNMLGVLAPSNKRVPAWDLPTVGSYKVFVCDTDERDALSAAIMEDLADPERMRGTEVGYDQYRINELKRRGLSDKRYLISKPLNEHEQMRLEQERKDRIKAEEEARKKAESDKRKFGKSTVKGEDSDSAESSDGDDSSGDSSDTESLDTTGGSDASSDDESTDSSESDSTSSSGDESEDSSGDSEDSDTEDED